MRWIPLLLAVLLLGLCACTQAERPGTADGDAGALPDGAGDIQQKDPADSREEDGADTPDAPDADQEESSAPEAPDKADGEQAPPAGSGQGAPEEPESTDKEPDDAGREATAPAEQDAPQEPAVPKVTLSVQCGAILDNMDDLDPDKAELVPADGVLYAATELELTEGESVFDVLSRAMRDAKIHMEYSSTPIYQSAYIEGIGNLYELDCGPLSGWMYRVNGEFPPYGCSRWMVQDGDVIEWLYTCDLGRDIGGEDALAGQKE